MSNLEHVFESALEFVKNEYDLETWIAVMINDNCHHNAKCTFTQRVKNGKRQMGAELNDGRVICLNDIWELAQYTYPYFEIAEDMKED